MARQGYNATVIKEENDIRIKDIIFKNAPISRGEVASSLSLTLPAITGRVSEMLKEGILVETEKNDSSEKSVGRKPQYLQINPEFGYVIGIETGPYMTGISLMNAAGKIVRETALPLMPGSYDDMVQLTKQYVDNVLKENHISKKDVIGVGVGLPGFVDNKAGVVRSSKRNDWNGKPLADDLAGLLKIPVVIDNNVRVRAIREEYCSSTYRPATFLYYFVSYGVSSSLLINHDIFSGYTAGAGEVGHMILNYDPCNKKDCRYLENYGSELAIINRCTRAVQEGKCTVLRETCSNPDELTMKEIMNAAEQGDVDVKHIIAESMEYLGVGLANVINFINPKLVLVEGYVMGVDENRETLQKTVYENLFGLNSSEVKIEFIPFNKFSGSRGAGMLALKKYLIEQDIQKMAK